MSTTSPLTSEYLAAPNGLVSAASGITTRFAGSAKRTPALVLLQHFRGNLDN